MIRMLLAAILVVISLPAFPYSMDELSGSIEGRRMRLSSTKDRIINRDHEVIEPWQTITLDELEGPGIIQHIWFTNSSRDFRYPASTIMRIYWDDHPEPSIQAPLGDFFASGNGMRANINSTPVQVSSYGRSYNCFWSMPFKKKARITFENQSNIRMSAIYVYIDWLKLDKPKKDGMYFHAQYRQEMPHDPAHDYTILETKGRGHYVGTVLSSLNGYNGWFGEGNDRIFVDGEKEPSLTGTGTEDYFNDAWGFWEFSHPNAGCPIFEGRAIGSRLTGYRWHIADPIVYNKSLRFTIENKGWVSDESGKHYERFMGRRDNYSSVAFFYQEQQAKNVPAMPPKDKRMLPEVFLDGRAILKVATDVIGGVTGRRSSRSCWKGGYLRLRRARVGSSVSVPVDLKLKGRYSVSIWPVLTRDGGIYAVYLDGKKIESRIDFYAPGKLIEQTTGRMDILPGVGEHKLMLHYLDAGKHTLTFKCIGRNPQSHVIGGMEEAYNFGLNCVSFLKIPFEHMDRTLPKKSE
jgi:D-arabinan exo alpha-(1,3)/(1,5)-arabinofuranosidase (non-reducing end)